MRFVPLSSVLALALAAVVTANAAEPALRPGEYIDAGGWGRLTISAPVKGALPFSLTVVGPNAHLCDLEGRIVGGSATLEDSEPACVVDFVAKAGAVEVISRAESCREYCGVRAWFEGDYFTPAVGCDDTSRGSARAAFKRSYDRKDYGHALRMLSPLPQSCAKTLHWLERAEILNDIAITQYRLGDPAGCLRTLEPLAKDAATPDDEIEVDGWIAEHEAYLPIIKATRFNLGLCRKPKR